MLRKLLPLLGVFGFALTLLAAQPAQAEFDLRLTPERGGRDIRFTPAKPGREVRNEELFVTVPTDEDRQYRVLVQQTAPFMNAMGQALSPGSVKIFSPSSVSGTLRVVIPQDLVPGQQVIYTSDSLGTEEEFTLVFAADLQPTDGAGHYQTQLIFQLEAVDGGVPTVNVVLHVHVAISPEFNIQIRNVKGGRTLNFGRISRRRLQGGGTLEVVVSSGQGAPYRIYQKLIEPLSNATGRTTTAGDRRSRYRDPSFVRYQACTGFR